MLSFEECEPKRPPRWQKFPLASGTEKFDTTIGLDSIVTSHAPHPPAFDAGHEISDAGIAFPRALMAVFQAFHDLGQQRGLGRIGDVPNFMRTAAEDPQHIGLARIALGQRLAVTDAHHLRATLLIMALQPWNVREV